MATLVNYKCKSFIKLTPGVRFMGPKFVNSLSAATIPLFKSRLKTFLLR